MDANGQSEAFRLVSDDKSLVALFSLVKEPSVKQEHVVSFAQKRFYICILLINITDHYYTIKSNKWK